MKKNIVIVVASSGKNQEMADTIAKKASELGATSDIVKLDDLNLPVYSAKKEQDGIPADIQKVVELLSENSLHIYLAPEYNGSMPPALNNMIAWVSRSTKNWRDCFNAKSALIGTHSGGGGAYVLMAMRQQLSYIGVNVLGRQLLTNYQKPLSDESVADCLELLLK